MDGDGSPPVAGVRPVRPISLSERGGLAPPAPRNPQLLEAGFHLGQTALFTCIDRRKVVVSMFDANDQDHFTRPTAFRMKPVVEWLDFIGRRAFFLGQDFVGDLLEILVGLPADLAAWRQS